jgi:hypothetical protein
VLFPRLLTQLHAIWAPEPSAAGWKEMPEREAGAHLSPTLGLTGMSTPTEVTVPSRSPWFILHTHPLMDWQTVLTHVLIRSAPSVSPLGSGH